MSFQGVERGGGAAAPPPPSSPHSRLREYRNGYKRKTTAAEARRREEISEAQALGVEVVSKRVSADPTYDEREDAVIRALYPDKAAIRKRLPHRTACSIDRRIYRLKVAGPQKVWTDAEVVALRRVWSRGTPEEVRAALPGKTQTQIDHRARREGLKLRGKPPYALTGDRLCDEIRDRCRVLGYTMHYLDQISGTGTYFQIGGWKQKSGHRMTPMVRALKALGGALSVVWPDEGECIDDIDVGEAR